VEEEEKASGERDSGAEIGSDEEEIGDSEDEVGLVRDLEGPMIDASDKTLISSPV